MSTETPNTALNTDSAAAAFADFLEPPKEITEKSAQDVEAEVIEDLTKGDEKPEAEATEKTDAEASDDPMVTVKIDGKEVEIPLSELKNSYQKDKVSTERFMQAAEIKKTAEAEAAKAQADRQQYATQLQKHSAQLEGLLQEQSQIDWQAFIDSDPVGALKQQNLFFQRQAAFQRTQEELHALAEQAKAEQEKARQSFIAQQRDELLAKLPEWKDPAKATAEQTALAKYLVDQGFDKESVNSITDHKAVLIGRKAMLYDAMMAKANAAAKKVTAAPQKVMRPGVVEDTSMDKRQASFRQLSRTGRAEDAAALFAQII